MIEEWHIERINAAGIQEVKIRSVLTCETADGVCGTCYGRDLARGTPVNMGEAVGVIAAQSIGEPGTQLTMRTFHIGGAAQIADQSFIESNFEGTVRTRNRNVARNSDGDLIAMARNMAVVIVGADGHERAVHRIQYGATLKVDEGDTGEARPAHRRVGPLHPPDRHRGGRRHRLRGSRRGSSVRGDGGRVDGHHQARRHRLARQPAFGRPASRYRDPGRQGQDHQAAARRRGALPAAGRHHRRGRPRLEDPRRRHHRAYLDGIAKTRDITGGLPRVAELFEARRPKEAAVIAEKSGTIQFGRDYKNKRRITLNPADGSEAVEYLVAKGKHIYLQDGDIVEKGDYIVDGNPAPHDILAIKGVEELAAYLVNEIQEVYRLQGVNINDKHIEVIVRQMLQKVEIDDPGDSEYLANEQVDKVEMDQVNVGLVADGKRPATGHPVLLGITKASLQTRSFISAASFQETTRVLTEAAVNGKSDELGGLKENVIVGRLIPAGTGAMMTRLREIAMRRDEMIVAQGSADSQVPANERRRASKARKPPSKAAPQA